MRLIKYENGVVSPADEMFYVKAFRNLYSSDRTKAKERFMGWVSYIFFMQDPRSPYMKYTDLAERRKAIVKGEGLGDGFRETPAIQEAMGAYDVFTESPARRLLDSMRVALDKIGVFLRNVDLDAVDDKGKPLYTANSIAQVTDKIPELTKKLIEAERIVDAEIRTAGRARGGNERKKMFEDGV